MATPQPIRLPRQWPEHVKAGILHAISLASVGLASARGRVAGQQRLRARLEQAGSEIALLREELSIKDGRWERARSRRRPHYIPCSPPTDSALLRHPALQQSKGSRGFVLSGPIFDGI